MIESKTEGWEQKDALRFNNLLDLKLQFNHKAEACGCHCTIKGCGDAQCGIIALETYLDEAYKLGLKQGRLEGKLTGQDVNEISKKLGYDQGMTDANRLARAEERTRLLEIIGEMKPRPMTDDEKEIYHCEAGILHVLNILIEKLK